MKTLILLIMIIFNGFESCKAEKLKAENLSEKKYLYILPQSGAHFRKKPNRQSESIELLPYKSFVEYVETSSVSEIIEERSNFWIKVKNRETEGYIFGAFLSPNYPVDRNYMKGVFQRVSDSTPFRSTIKMKSDGIFYQDYMLCHSSMKTEGVWKLSINYQGEFPVQVIKFTYTKNEFNQPSPPPFFAEIISKDKMRIVDSDLSGGGCEINADNTYLRISD